MVDNTGAASAAPAVWLSRIEWSIRSRSTGTPNASNTAAPSAAPIGISGVGGSGVMFFGATCSTTVA
jgi:hypothetical protein